MYYIVSLIWVVVSNIFSFHPYLGKIPILTNIFSKGLKPPTRLHCITHVLLMLSHFDSNCFCFESLGKTHQPPPPNQRNPPANPCTPKSSPFPFLVSSQFTSLRSCCLHLGFLVPQLFAPWQLKFPKLLGFPEVSWGFLRFPEVSWFRFTFFLNGFEVWKMITLLNMTSRPVYPDICQLMVSFIWGRWHPYHCHYLSTVSDGKPPLAYLSWRDTSASKNNNLMAEFKHSQAVFHLGLFTRDQWWVSVP